MDKKLLYGIGIGAVAVALYLYLNRNKFKNAPASKPASAPASKPAPAPASANKPASPTPATSTTPIFVDDRHLPSFADTLVTPSTAPIVPLNRELFEIPFSPQDILPKGIQYNYQY